MSKFGLMTFYREKNYGAQLQAFALQSAICNLGYESEFIQYRDPRESKNDNHPKTSIYEKLKTVKFSLKNYFLIKSALRESAKRFNDFVERYMKVSKRFYSSLDELKAFEYEYDGFVTGSDMVWSDIGQNLDAYFLTFTSPEKRLSYAPSLTGREGESSEERARYCDWLNGIRYISCREQYGVDYVKSTTGREAELVADPTLLLTKDGWAEKLKIREDDSQKYILVYMFNGESISIKNQVEYFAKNMNCQIKYIPMGVDDILYEDTHGSSLACGPREFVELFYNAGFVFTNSFHGLLFSIIMNKSFFLIHRGRGNAWAKHEERMNNIISQIGLHDRFIYSDDSIKDRLTAVDYSKINPIVESLRYESLEYLQKALSCILENHRVLTK